MRRLTFCLLMLAVGCQTRQPEAMPDDAGPRAPFRGVPVANLSHSCVEGYDPSVDYFPDKATPQYARIFTIDYRRNYKVVKLAVERTSAEQGTVADTMVLVQCGTPVPPLRGDLAGATVITVPVMSIASNDNCDIAAITELGLDQRLMAIGGGHLYNRNVRERWQRKELATIGYAWHGLPDSEILLARPPDVLFMRRATLEQGRSLERARKLGIRAAPTLARMEQHYLGYAEWVKFFAAFLNVENVANEHFSKVSERSETLARAARQAPVKPTVFWAGLAAGGTWSAARSPLDLRTRYLMDVGIRNPLYDENALPSGQLTNEQLLALGADADFWISDNHTPKGWPDRNYLDHFKAYRDNRILHHEKRTIFELDAYDWYELGAMRPDLVLEDLVSLFHPEILSGHELVFFDRVSREAGR